MGSDLRANALAALALDRNACRKHALGFTWQAVAQQFIANLALARSASAAA